MAKSKSKQGGSLRIIGGSWRGRKLDFPEVDGLRPTGDRIRETLFNWLQMVVGDARCLDLFAGSGALGFEAASRGASHVDMVELDVKALRQLQQNVAVLKADVCQLHQMTAQQFLSQAAGPYHLVFIDPPFQANLWQQTVNQLLEQNLLADSARIYIEMPARSEAFDTPATWKLLKEKRAGDVKYCLFEHLAGVEHA